MFEKKELKAYLILVPLVYFQATTHRTTGVILAESKEVAQAFAEGGADTPTSVIVQEVPLFTQEVKKRTRRKHFPVDTSPSCVLGESVYNNRRFSYKNL